MVATGTLGGWFDEQMDAVRAVWDAFERGEMPFDAFEERAEWYTASDLPDKEVLVGPAEIAQMLAKGWETVVDGGCKADEIVEDGGRVLVRWHGWGTGRASGIPVDWREVHAYEVRDGKIAIVREYRTWEEALRGQAGADSAG